jgi:hypothetical protein
MESPVKLRSKTMPTDQIDYKQETPHRIVVLLGKKQVGTIKKVEGGYAYFPKGSKTSGEPFDTVSKVMASLESLD